MYVVHSNTTDDGIYALGGGGLLDLFEPQYTLCLFRVAVAVAVAVACGVFRFVLELLDVPFMICSSNRQVLLALSERKCRFEFFVVLFFFLSVLVREVFVFRSLSLRAAIIIVVVFFLLSFFHDGHNTEVIKMVRAISSSILGFVVVWLIPDWLELVPVPCFLSLVVVWL